MYVFWVIAVCGGCVIFDTQTNATMTLQQLHCELSALLKTHPPETPISLCAGGQTRLLDLISCYADGVLMTGVKPIKNRDAIDARNKAIATRHRAGEKILDLAIQYNLSTQAIYCALRKAYPENAEPPKSHRLASGGERGEGQECEEI